MYNTGNDMRETHGKRVQRQVRARRKVT